MLSRTGSTNFRLERRRLKMAFRRLASSPQKLLFIIWRPPEFSRYNKTDKPAFVWSRSKLAHHNFTR